MAACFHLIALQTTHHGLWKNREQQITKKRFLQEREKSQTAKSCIGSQVFLF